MSNNKEKRKTKRLNIRMTENFHDQIQAKCILEGIEKKREITPSSKGRELFEMWVTNYQNKFDDV